MRNNSWLRNGRHGLPAVSLLQIFCLALVLVAAVPAVALDLFTLWKQPEIPLSMREGSWVDYRTQVMAGGRREESLTRLVCLNRQDGTDDRSFLLEILPLQEDPVQGLIPIPGQGAQVRLSRKILQRQGDLLDAVVAVWQWDDGRMTELSPADLREDPLLSSSFSSDFSPDQVQSGQTTTRIVKGQQFSCQQWVWASADTQSVVMPAGRMRQISSREIAAAINEDLPFLGIAYASERVRAVSTLDPPNRKIPVPPARIRAEVMELVGFGQGARGQLTRKD